MPKQVAIDVREVVGERDVVIIPYCDCVETTGANREVLFLANRPEGEIQVDDPDVGVIKVQPLQWVIGLYTVDGGLVGVSS